MGLLDRLKRSAHDEGSIRGMLEESGATAEQAEEIVQPRNWWMLTPKFQGPSS